MSSQLITHEYRIKGMMCGRCLKVLNTEVRGTGAEILEIQLGKIVIRYDPGKIEKSLVERIFHNNEFEILWYKESILAERTKRWGINYLWSTVPITRK